MATEILDVIDTAVKIGFGAAISGVTAFYVGKQNNKNERDRFFLEHKLETLE